MHDFTPANPDFVNAIRASFAQQGIMRHLGAKLEQVSLLKLPMGILP